jgi:Ca-activated chloride channel family protein
VPDLFKGQQLVLAGRYSGQGDGAIQIEGTVDGETKKFAYDVKFPKEASDHEFIPRLWATRRVGYLFDEIRLRGESKELKEEVTELARKYSIVTPYTAYLIVEDEKQRGLAQNLRTLRVEDQLAEREIFLNYESLRKDKAGDVALGSARSTFDLKSAQVASEAIVLGRQEAIDGLARAPKPMMAPASPVPSRANRRTSGAGGFPPPAVTAASPQGAKPSDAYAQQTRFVGGRTFFQNGEQWIDTEVQKRSAAKPVRVQFGSVEYFDLLKKYPQTLSWLALGRNVQFTLGEVVYEIYE